MTYPRSEVELIPYPRTMPPKGPHQGDHAITHSWSVATPRNMRLERGISEKVPSNIGTRLALVKNHNSPDMKVGRDGSREWPDLCLRKNRQRHARNTTSRNENEGVGNKRGKKAFINTKNISLREAYYNGYPNADTKMTDKAQGLAMWLESTKKTGMQRLDLQRQRKKSMEDGPHAWKNISTLSRSSPASRRWLPD